MSASLILGFPGGASGKESASIAGDLGLISGLGRSPGGGHGNPLQYSCLENSMDRRAWRASVYRLAKSRTQLKRLSTHKLDFSPGLFGLQVAVFSLCLCLCPAAAAAKSLQLCPTLCDPIDGSPPGSVIPGILQERTLEWAAISFSNA